MNRHVTSLVFPDVVLGDDADLGAYVIVGERPSAAAVGQQTVIGRGARIRSHTVIYHGNRIGDDFQTGHGVLIRECNRIGNGVSIGTHSIVEHHVEIGAGVRIHSNAFVPEYSVLEPGCWIGPCVVVTNARYPTSRRAKETLEGVRIERGARVGAGAVLLPGIRVGAQALVGAGAVVTHDVPAGAVVVGNPARVVNRVDDIDAYRDR